MYYARIGIMNELFFFLHTIITVLFVLGAFAISKEALIACICIQGVFVNLFVVKQITLFGLDVTSSDVFAVGGVLGLNLLQEYFGSKIVKKTIWISFFLVFFYVVMSQLHLLYVPNAFDTTHNFFKGILQFMPRITAASLFVYLLVQRLDCFLYGFLKKIFQSKYFVVRNIFSTFSSQFIDTVLFSFLGLYGIVGSITNVIFMSFAIKVLVIFISAPMLFFAKKFIKQKSVDFQAATVDKIKDNKNKKIKEIELR